MYTSFVFMLHTCCLINKVKNKTNLLIISTYRHPANHVIECHRRWGAPRSHFVRRWQHDVDSSAELPKASEPRRFGQMRPTTLGGNPNGLSMAVEV